MDNISMMEDPNGYIFNTGNYLPVEKCQVELLNQELWREFHGLQTEMIITKTGRRMFPSINVSFKNLNPSQKYCVFMELICVENCRFKYSSSIGWSPGGPAEHQSDRRLYLHPESPSTGNYWTNQPISFHRVKLTNTVSPPDGQMVLNSMHKYQPRLIILESDNPRDWSAPKKYIDFLETAFIAVTAYQNDKVTKLKIHYNPFAKGFRENGKSCVKRRQTSAEDSNEVTERNLKKRTPSPPLSATSVSPPSYYPVYSISPERIAMPPVFSPYYHQPYAYPAYPVYNHYLPPYPMYYQYPPIARPPPETIMEQEQGEVVPKKFTDFSIRSLINID